MPIQIERITVKEAVARYLRSDEMKAKSDNTQANTKSTLMCMVAFLGSYIQVHKLERADMNRFFSDRAEIWGNGTYNAKLGHIRALFSWCRAEGFAYPDWDPVRARKQRSYVENERVWITAEQYEAGRLLAPDARDRAFWDFAWYSGCRANEITRLKVGDLDFKAGRYRKTILKKRGGVVIKWKPLGSGAEDAMAEWLDWYGGNQKLKGVRMDPDFYLFPSRSFIGWRPDDPSIYEAILDSPKPQKMFLRPTMPTSEAFAITRRIGLRLKLDPNLRLGVHVLRRSGSLDDLKKMEEAEVARPIARVRVKLDHQREDTTLHYTGKDHDEELADDWYHRDGKYAREQQAARAAEIQPSAGHDNVVQLFPRRNVG